MNLLKGYDIEISISTKSMKIKKLNRLLCLFLSFMLIFSVLPDNVFVAEEKTTSNSLISDEVLELPQFGTMPNPDYQGETIEILSELTDRREENVKHFLLSDGTVKAVAYSEPIHFKDADGNWQEIDNTLTLAGDSAALYETADQRVSFAKSVALNGKIFTLGENGYSVSMSYLFDSKTSGEKVKASVGTVENKPAKKQALTLDTIDALPKSDSGKISYSGLPGNVELVYELLGSNIKESIVLHSPGSV